MEIEELNEKVLRLASSLVIMGEHVKAQVEATKVATDALCGLSAALDATRRDVATMSTIGDAKTLAVIAMTQGKDPLAVFEHYRSLMQAQAPEAYADDAWAGHAATLRMMLGR